jgi:Fe2+ transport system protein B
MAKHQETDKKMQQLNFPTARTEAPVPVLPMDVVAEMQKRQAARSSAPASNSNEQEAACARQEAAAERASQEQARKKAADKAELNRQEEETRAKLAEARAKQEEETRAKKVADHEAYRESNKTLLDSIITKETASMNNAIAQRIPSTKRVIGTIVNIAITGLAFGLAALTGNSRNLVLGALSPIFVGAIHNILMMWNRQANGDDFYTPEKISNAVVNAGFDPIVKLVTGKGPSERDLAELKDKANGSHVKDLKARRTREDDLGGYTTPIF